MKRTIFFAVTCVAVIAVVWLLAEVLFPDDAGRQALGTAAAVAFVVQMVAFLVARDFARRKNVMAGWGIGIALRFVALLLFGLVAVPMFALPLAPALVSLAVFLFVSTLIEPLFLKQG
jgi:hypothetical protein